MLTVALLWALARRIFGRGPREPLAAALAALLAAISPLYLYYGQEARMYTQLVFFGALAGYGLWRAMEEQPALVVGLRSCSPRWPPLYTHYFALFLLAAYGICAWRCRTPSRQAAGAWQRLGPALDVGCVIAFRRGRRWATCPGCPPC